MSRRKRQRRDKREPWPDKDNDTITRKDIMKHSIVALAAFAALSAQAIVIADPPQQQQQQQSQGDTNARSYSNSHALATGGAASAAGGTGLAAAQSIGGNQTVTVAPVAMGAGVVDNMGGVFAAPVIHQRPTQIAAPGLMMTTSACGPMVGKTRAEVVGTFIGLIGDNSVALGWDEDLYPVADPITGALGYYASVTMRDGTVRYFGDQVTTVAAVINVGGGRSLSLFGSGGSGAGQVGIGGNSAMQRLVLRHSIQICDAGSVAPVPVQQQPVQPQPVSQLPVIERVRQ